VRPEKDRLLDAHLLLQVLNGSPDYFFHGSCRLNRFQRVPVCAR
jgi:hypothetical protein